MPNDRKSFHLQEYETPEHTRFATCGRVSYEVDRMNGKGPVIGPSIPFKHAESQCLICYRNWQAGKIRRDKPRE